MKKAMALVKSDTEKEEIDKLTKALKFLGYKSLGVLVIDEVKDSDDFVHSLLFMHNERPLIVDLFKDNHFNSYRELDPVVLSKHDIISQYSKLCDLKVIGTDEIKTACFSVITEIVE